MDNPVDMIREKHKGKTVTIDLADLIILLGMSGAYVKLAPDSPQRMEAAQINYLMKKKYFTKTL